jgi:hypothetical protein
MHQLGHSRWILALVGALLSGASWAAAAPASAQSTVIVLGIRSFEGDDEFARNLTGALRHAASQVQEWTVSDREVTLAQMALAHGCEEPDPTCLRQMAGSLSTQRIVYGDVRRTSASGTYDWSVNLHVFNAETDRIEHSVAEIIPGGRSDIDDLREPVRRFMARLSGAPQVGTLRVSVNVPGAEVFIDGESVGVADASGELRVPDVRSGSRNIRVAAPGHQGFRSTVSVEPYGEASFEAELQASASSGGGGDGIRAEVVAGIGLLGTAVGLAAAWIGSWAHVQFGLQNDPGYAQFRRDAAEFLRATQGAEVDLGQVDVCALQAENGSLFQDPTPAFPMGRQFASTGDRAAQVCSEASTFEALQFVFGIGAAAAAGAGLYFLIAGLSGGDASAPEEQSFRLLPSLGPDHAYLGVHLTF